ncbi:glyoxylate carboligase [Candidatus Bathyarchaeota archaeon]|nr:glyoxylate carboligase [Candidatus Bathyarchaeota archaeon]
MAKIPVMEAVVSILEDEGVEAIFGIPGAGILPFYQALQKSKKITHYLCRHEEGAIHAADGYARISGKVGLCAGTSGPAGTNMVTGLYTAQVDSIPLIALTGQNVRAQLGRQAFQAVEIAEIVKPVTKKSYCVMESDQLPWVFREAFRIAREGRPGPVLIDLPLDVQKGQVEYDPVLDSRLSFQRPTPPMGKIKRALEMILEAKSPVFLLGGGVILSEATKEFADLAEYLAVPVVTTLMGKGGIRSDHPLYAGQVGIQCGTPLGNKTFLESDLVLGVGCRFSDRHTGKLDVYTKDRRFIHIDIEPTQIGRIIHVDLGIVSDARLALQAMLEKAKDLVVGSGITEDDDPPAQVAVTVPKQVKISDRVKMIADLRQKMARRTDFDQVPIKPQRVFKEINEFFDEDTLFVTCIGLNQIWSSQLQDIFKPRHYILPGGAGPLGWDLPAAIGAKLARPDCQVVQVTGDYGLQFCIEELGVGVMYELPFLVIIINNGYLSLIRQAEKYIYDMEYEVEIWYEDQKVDFVKLADAYGAYAERVTEPKSIKGAFQRGIDSGKPALIDIIVERETDASMGPALDAIVEHE